VLDSSKEARLSSISRHILSMSSSTSVEDKEKDEGLSTFALLRLCFRTFWLCCVRYGTSKSPLSKSQVQSETSVGAVSIEHVEIGEGQRVLDSDHSEDESEVPES